MADLSNFSQRGYGLLAGAILALSPLLSPLAATAQQVVNFSPAGQDVPSDSTIAWQFDNAGLVNARSIRLFLNDKDVTTQTILDPARNYFGYRPAQPLPPGNHTVKIEFTNTQGAGYRATWNFAVPSNAIAITAITHNGAGTPRGRGENFLATINGTPGGTASVLLVQNGQTVRTLPATEVSPGVYVATVTVGMQDAVREGILVGRLTKNSQVVYSVATQAFVFDPSITNTQVTQTQTSGGTTNPTTPTTPPTAAALTLTLTSPSNNAMINSASGFTLTGTTTPGATVLVDVTASPPRLGPISVGAPQIVLDNATATVAADGTFALNVPSPTVLQGGMKYTVVVTATLNGVEKQAQLNLSQSR